MHVPAGFPQTGQTARFQAPSNMRAGQYIDVPLPPLEKKTFSQFKKKNPKNHKPKPSTLNPKALNQRIVN